MKSVGPRHTRASLLGISLGLVAIVATIYGRVARHPFVVFDDIDYILNNPRVRQGITRDGVTWAFTSFHAANWHPLTWISHMLDAQIFGVTDRGAGGHHLVSLGLHSLNAVLLFLVLCRMTGHLWASALVAALFATHPLRVESVAWASERKDVLSGSFFMLTLLAYAAFVERPGIVRYAWVLLTLTVGLLAKPILVTVPLVLLLLDVWPLGRLRLDPALRAETITSMGMPTSTTRVRLSTLLLEKLPLFVVCMASSLVTIEAQSKGGAVSPLGSVPLAWRLIEAPISYSTYLWKTVWPTDLAVFYPHPANLRFESIESWIVPAALSGFFLLAVTVATVSVVKRSPYFTVGWLWFVVMLVPVIGLVQVGAQSWADRYAYLPLIGVYLMLAVAARDFVARHRKARVMLTLAAGSMIAALGLASWFQVDTWRDSRTLFEHALRVTKNNWLIHNNLGVLLLNQGDWDEAQRHFERALSIQPNYAQAHDNLGRLLFREGRLEEARSHCERALELYPDYAQAHFDLACVFERQGKLEEARNHFERAVSIRPDWGVAHERLARVLVQDGDLVGAVVELEKLARAYPTNPEFAFLAGMARETQGDSSAAGRWYRRAAELPNADKDMRAKARKFGERARAPASAP